MYIDGVGTHHMHTIEDPWPPPLQNLRGLNCLWYCNFRSASIPPLCLNVLQVFVYHSIQPSRGYKSHKLCLIFTSVSGLAHKIEKFLISYFSKSAPVTLLKLCIQTDMWSCFVMRAWKMGVPDGFGTFGPAKWPTIFANFSKNQINFINNLANGLHVICLCGLVECVDSYYTVSQKNWATFLAYNFRNIEQIFTKFGTNQSLFILNIMPEFI